MGSPSPYGMVLTDLLMPDGSGLDLLTVARQRSAQTEVIVMTAHSTLETAIEAMKRGAYDFITKPFATSELRALVDKAFEKRALLAENEALRALVSRDHPPRPPREVGADAPDRGPDPPHRLVAHDGPHHRRERDRQRAHRARSPRALGPRRTSRSSS